MAIMKIEVICHFFHFIIMCFFIFGSRPDASSSEKKKVNVARKGRSLL